MLTFKIKSNGLAYKSTDPIVQRTKEKKNAIANTPKMVKHKRSIPELVELYMDYGEE